MLSTNDCKHFLSKIDTCDHYNNMETKPHLEGSESMFAIFESADSLSLKLNLLPSPGFHETLPGVSAAEYFQVYREIIFRYQLSK